MSPSATTQFAALLQELPPCLAKDGPIAALSRALVYGYADTDRRKAAQLAFQANMEAGVARGKGYRAGRRAAQLGYEMAQAVQALERRMALARQEEAWIRRIQRERARAWADEVSELVSESRSFAHHYKRAVNE